MGDIADMMLDGTLCEGCGVYMGDTPGFVQRCGSCQQADRMPAPGALVPCPTCGKQVKSIGLPDHHKAAHGVELTRTGKTPCTVCGKRVKLVGLTNHMRHVHGWKPLPAGVVVGQPVNDGGQYYAADGTFMNADGTRSIFDDVDEGGA